MSISRQHFNAIAKAIRNSNENKDNIIYNIANCLKQFNSNFDKDRFIEACK